MPTGSPQFNCGEYRPGQQPINVPPISPPNPPIIIPGGSNPQLPRFPQFPVRIPNTREPRIPNTSGGPGGGGQPGQTGGGQPGGGNPGQPGQSQPFPQTHPGAKYRCTEGKFYCPDDSYLPEAQRRVILIRRLCSICYPLLNPETGTYQYEPDCVYPTLQNCQSVCKDQSTPQNCIEPIRQFPQSESQQPVRQIEQRPNQVVIPVVTVEIDPNIISNQVQVVLEPNSSNTQPVLYHPELNIFEHQPTTEIVLQYNTLYPQVFRNQVAQEVAYFLNNENSISNWDERIVQNLSNQRIEQSLLPTLIEVFDRITYPGGLVVGREPFIQAVKRHLLTGTMVEFQPEHFIQTYNAQSSNQRISIKPARDRETAERAALGLAQLASIPADTNKLQSIELWQVRRQRRLNEDIGARIPICPIDNESNDLFAGNAGICTTTEDYGSIPLQNGNGDGYYLYLNTVAGGCKPLQYTSNIANTFYVQNELRNTALNVAGVDFGITLTAQSTTQHELTAGDQNQITFEPLYMALELSSVSGIPDSNSLVDTTTARYSLLTDQTLINEHTDSNGFAVTRANLDYRDPLYRYIKETSSVTLEQKDLTFRSFDENVSIVNGAVLSRNIPFALVVTPVNGSKFNPFNGSSKITDFGTTVTRSIRMVPDIQYGDRDPKPNQLQQVNLFDEGSLRVGIAEPNDGQNITYRFYASSPALTNTILTGNTYQSTVPQVSSYGMSYLVKDVVDYLVSSQNPEVMSWFDVYRRMPLNRFGELLYDNNQDLLNQLANGLRNEVKITHVLNRMDEDSYPVLDEDSRVILQR